MFMQIMSMLEGRGKRRILFRIGKRRDYGNVVVFVKELQPWSCQLMTIV